MLIPAISFTNAQAAATTNIQIAAYTKLIIAFLNCSGFPLAMRSLQPIKRNIPIATTAIRANIPSLAKRSKASNSHSQVSAEVST